MSPKTPKLPRLPLPQNPLEPIREVIREGRQEVEKTREAIRSIANELRGAVTEASKEPTTASKIEGTACLSCTRDHFSTTSAALSEALRFARSEGIKHTEVTRRLGIALDELNILERIDLAPDQLGMLSEPERKLAIWALNASRNLRHVLGDIRSLSTLEKAAGKASEVRDEFMNRFWTLEEECPECFSLATLRDYIEKRKRERQVTTEQ